MPIAMQYGSGKYTAQQQGSGGGSAGGITMTLLWTNPSPTSSFAAQTVPLDLSSYDMVMVFCRQSTSDGTLTSQMGPKSTDIRVINMYNNRFVRTYSWTDTGVAIGSALRANYNASLSTDNAYQIPMYIYGIKGIT